MKSQDQKRIEAAERKAYSDSLSTAEKLEIVIARRKRGLTSQREFDRLQARLTKEREAAKVATPRVTYTSAKQ